MVQNSPNLFVKETKDYFEYLGGFYFNEDKSTKKVQINWPIYPMQETSLFLDDSDCSVFLPGARDSVC